MLAGIFITSEWLEWSSNRNNVTPTALQVLGVYLLHMNTDTGVAFPAYARIMGITGLRSNRSVATYIDELQRIGVLKFVKYRKGYCKEYKVKCYDKRLKKLRSPISDEQ